ELSGWGRKDLFEALRTADSKNEWIAAQAAANAEYAKHKINLKTFHAGGVVSGMGEQLALLLGGEGVLSRRAMRAIGGAQALKDLNNLPVRWRTPGLEHYEPKDGGPYGITGRLFDQLGVVR